MKDIEKNVSNEIAEAAKTNMSQWLETLSTKDPQKVAELYADNATFFYQQFQVILSADKMVQRSTLLIF